ncbi:MULTISPECIES: helix-turn-helix domain-containing protein [Nonomuraea]|uniref:helix-turn-helix domain-containing protein n=1 Tax=Nonomuraea TaxID=83681 RepID=UPI00332AB0DD
MTIEELGDKLFATVPEVGRILRADERTIRKAIGEGQIPATKVGAIHRVPVAWLRGQALLSAPEIEVEVISSAA